VEQTLKVLQRLLIHTSLRVEKRLNSRIITAVLLQSHVARLTSESEEAQYIAYQFKRAHLMQGIPYSQMAVIVRSHGNTASAIRRAFSQVSIPTAGDIEALAHNAAIAPFLLLARVATGCTAAQS
jgi:hypothetical protein